MTAEKVAESDCSSLISCIQRRVQLVVLCHGDVSQFNDENAFSAFSGKSKLHCEFGSRCVLRGEPLATTVLGLSPAVSTEQCRQLKSSRAQEAAGEAQRARTYLPRRSGVAVTSHLSSRSGVARRTLTADWSLWASVAARTAEPLLAGRPRRPGHAERSLDSNVSRTAKQSRRTWLSPRSLRATESSRSYHAQTLHSQRHRKLTHHTKLQRTSIYRSLIHTSLHAYIQI